ncbi:hypothetical protein GCK32_020472 [Trichostrongylus colubriformis]|uniref:Uncharacterized protein n=1 Tax=Trichostrongylus colubriformis TaxID=6319 RepID=A0AAN8IK01_TRICO
MRENEDDSPLYIFDEYFGEHKQTMEMLEDFEVPPYFNDDLFDILENMKRPPHRFHDNCNPWKTTK